ncbi:uncharacterized protein LOC117338296 [Pecten maximus]|uniref:uncharacterized protein LOC117338296 n=1 Tax=Pecten maximus TaxID=6579 RepID=UPI0014587281|nr:uncharacterized protein LOC117338296 [Pecten maximus]
MATLCTKKSLEQDLDKFRSTFEFDTTNLDTDRVRTLIRKLEDDQKNTTKSKDENRKIIHFLSYLYFRLDDHKHALQLIEVSLQEDPDNIIANANKARILLENGKDSEVEKIISRLQDLEIQNDYDKRKCYAEADLAYAYARSGPWYYQRAVDLYSRLVEAYPSEYAWQFGLGLTLLRQTHHVHSRADVENEKTTLDAAERLLAATKSDDPILSAKAYAELGRAVYNIEKRKYGDLPPHIKKLRYKDCFKKALEICSEEPSVLQICGQYARYSLDFDESETLLRKALQKKPTPQSYHHLALTLAKMVEMPGGHSTERNRPEESGDEDGFICVGGKKRKRPNQTMKSPLKVQVYPGNSLLKEAIELIDKAEELDSNILNIQYDKGILYRMLGETANAVEVFKQIISKRKSFPTKTVMTYAEEQLRFCLLELDDSKEIPPDKKRKYENDDQSQPFLWNRYSTLQEPSSDESDG